MAISYIDDDTKRRLGLLPYIDDDLVFDIREVRKMLERVSSGFPDLSQAAIRPTVDGGYKIEEGRGDPHRRRLDEPGHRSNPTDESNPTKPGSMRMSIGSKSRSRRGNKEDDGRSEFN